MGRYEDRWERHREKVERHWDKMERRQSHRHSPASGFVVGAIIVAIGTLMLLDNLGIVRAVDFWDYVPLILVALGAAKILQSQGRPAPTLFGVILATAGTLWFLNNIDVLRIDHRLIAPVLIIGLGLLFLARALERQREIASADPASVPAQASDPGQVNLWTVFGGHKRVLETNDFRAGDLFAVFGGIDLDLRRSGMTQNAVIDANAIFGGIEIRVPLNWTVDVHGNGIFGGYEDKTIHPAPDPNMPVFKLTVTGFAIFGGISVSNT